MEKGYLIDEKDIVIINKRNERNFKEILKKINIDEKGVEKDIEIIKNFMENKEWLSSDEQEDAKNLLDMIENVESVKMIRESKNTEEITEKKIEECEKINDIIGKLLENVQKYEEINFIRIAKDTQGGKEYLYNFLFTASVNYLLKIIIKNLKFYFTVFKKDVKNNLIKNNLYSNINEVYSNIKINEIKKDKIENINDMNKINIDNEWINKIDNKIEEYIKNMIDIKYNEEIIKFNKKINDLYKDKEIIINNMEKYIIEDKENILELVKKQELIKEILEKWEKKYERLENNIIENKDINLKLNKIEKIINDKDIEIENIKSKLENIEESQNIYNIIIKNYDNYIKNDYDKNKISEEIMNIKDKITILNKEIKNFREEKEN
jgi:hypothetical protein